MLCITVILLQVSYLLTSYRQDKTYIKTSKNQIQLIKKRIQKLDRGVHTLADDKEELESLMAQNKALFETIPTFISASKETAELLRYMYANDFKKIRLEAITENDTMQLEEQFILGHTYELTFVGRYQEVRDLINHMNQSYQMIHIEGLELSNEVQDMANEQNISLYEVFGEDFYKIVRATLKLTLYTRQNELGDEEIYQPDLDLRVHSERAFSTGLKKQIHKADLSKQEEEEKDLFTLNIGDFLTSGDTYKFGGPGEDGYVGLITETDVKIQLVLKENTYEMSIEDADGKKNQVTIQATLTHPEMHIISTMRAVYEIMPNISVFIDNRTNQLLTIDISGDLTETIKIFNESGYLLTRGETKGKIKLT